MMITNTGIAHVDPIAEIELLDVDLMVDIKVEDVVW